MKGWVLKRCWPWAVATLVLLAGCHGVFLESKEASGRVERFRIEGGEGWNDYGDRPRPSYVGSGKHGMDDMGLMLLREMTF